MFLRLSTFFQTELLPIPRLKRAFSKSLPEARQIEQKCNARMPDSIDNCTEVQEKSFRAEAVAAARRFSAGRDLPLLDPRGYLL
jgi:hypothetical protein